MKLLAAAAGVGLIIMVFRTARNRVHAPWKCPVCGRVYGRKHRCIDKK